MKYIIYKNYPELINQLKIHAHMCVYKSNPQGTVRKKGVEFCCVSKVICQTEPAAFTIKFPLVHYDAKAQVTTDCVGSSKEQKCYSSPLHTADSPCLPRGFPAASHSFLPLQIYSPSS